MPLLGLCNTVRCSLSYNGTKQFSIHHLCTTQTAEWLERAAPLFEFINPSSRSQCDRRYNDPSLRRNALSQPWYGEIG